MNEEQAYQVMVLPERKIVERGLSLHEAGAWVTAYNRAMQGSARQAVIACEVNSEGEPQAE